MTTIYTQSQWTFVVLLAQGTAQSLWYIMATFRYLSPLVCLVYSYKRGSKRQCLVSERLLILVAIDTSSLLYSCVVMEWLHICALLSLLCSFECAVPQGPNCPRNGSIPAPKTWWIQSGIRAIRISCWWRECPHYWRHHWVLWHCRRDAGCPWGVCTRMLNMEGNL